MATDDRRVQDWIEDHEINPLSANIGDGTNYTEIKTDGEINLHAIRPRV